MDQTEQRCPAKSGLPCRQKLLFRRFYGSGWENSFNRLKDFRRLSLRLDKMDTSFRGFLAFAAAILNWRLKVRLCAQAQARQ